MNPEPIGHTRCGTCGGTRTTHDEMPCPTCNGTGLVEVFPAPPAPSTQPAGPTGSSNRQRRFPRYYTDLPLALRDQQEREFTGRCVVIAEGGLAAVLSEPITVGSVVTLRLSVPCPPTVLEAWAIVRNQVGLRHGFEFVSLPDPEREVIRQFCCGLTIQSEPGPVVPQGSVTAQGR